MTIDHKNLKTLNAEMLYKRTQGLHTVLETILTTQATRLSISEFKECQHEDAELT